MAKIILEARVNEFALRDENPNVPYLPEEIIADAQARNVPIHLPIDHVAAEKFSADAETKVVTDGFIF